MRRLIVVLSACVLVFGVLAMAETPVPETPGATVGGTLVIASSQTFKDLDPRIMNSMYDSYITQEVFDDFIYLHPETLKPEPFIAKSWDVISDRQTRFYLNEGIKFHNGEDLTAEDVVFTFNWMADPENNSPNYTELIWMEKAEMVDDYTVDIWTKEDYAPYCPGFANESQSIVPKDTVLEVGDEAFNLNPVGSGPYKFVEWKAGDHITLERNEDYWLVYPNLDKVIYRPIAELSVMMLELEAGGIDIADNMPAQDVLRFRENPDVEVLQCPSLSYFHMWFNMQHPPSNDIRWRKAVYMSVDMEAAVFSVFQGLTGVRSYGCIPPALWANDREYLRDNVALEEDDEEAKRLFQELKDEGVIPEGYTTTVYCPLDPRRTQMATIIATNMIENGINAIVQPLDWGPLLDLAYRSESDPTAAECDQMWMGWSGGPDPHDFIYYMFHSDNATVGSADNMSFYSNPVADDLMFRADTLPGCDATEREALFVEAQRIIYEDYAAIPGYHYIQTTPVRARVQGFLVDPFGNLFLCDPFHNVWVEG